MPATSQNVAVLGRNEHDDQEFIDSLPATTRAVVCGVLSARAELYKHEADTTAGEGDAVARNIDTDAAWARERFISMREHPSFARLLPVVRERVERLIHEADHGLYALTPRQVATLAAA